MLIRFYRFYGKIYFYTSHIWPQGGKFAHSSKHSGKFFSLNYCPESVVYAQQVSKHSGKVPRIRYILIVPGTREEMRLSACQKALLKLQGARHRYFQSSLSFLTLPTTLFVTLYM
jgi:hypothetical protein